jgi:hypothetical protein
MAPELGSCFFFLSGSTTLIGFSLSFSSSSFDQDPDGGFRQFFFEMGFVNFKNYRLYILTATAYMGSLLFGW